MSNVVKNTGVVSGSQCWASASLPSIGANSENSSNSLTGVYFVDNVVLDSCTQTFAVGDGVADVILAGNSWTAPHGQGIQLRTVTVALTIVIAGDAVANATNFDCLLAPTTVTGPLRLFVTESEFTNCHGYGIDVSSTSVQALQLTNSGGGGFEFGFAHIARNATSFQWIQGNQWETPAILATALGVAPPIAMDFNYSVTVGVSPITIDSSIFVAQATVGGGLRLSLVAVYGRTDGTALLDLSRTTVSIFPIGSETPGSPIGAGTYSFNYVIASKDGSGTIQGIDVGRIVVMVTQESQSSGCPGYAHLIYSPLIVALLAFLLFL